MNKLLLLSALVFSTLFANDALPSWNEGTSKTNIMNYVKSVTKENSADFIPVKDRIATFDNDGTLWGEQPVYFQLFFAMDRVKEMVSDHPEWKTNEPFKSALADDMHGVMKSGVKGLLQIVNATHSGMDVETFKSEVKEWLKTAKHPTLNRPYTDLIYQPMMELIQYLEANDFKVYIVSGGGIDFMRSFVPEMYGIPEEHIIGSSGKVHYKDGKIMKNDDIYFIDDKETKPLAIYRHIGKRPVAAFGNSDGDFAMMKYTEANKHAKTFQLYVHHTDDKREVAYDRKSHIGKLDKGLDYANANGWTVVDMKNEWKIIYPFELEK
ncbi:HAD family hydrolase [Sulfurovum sp.]|uniref:HAD family hydrolase n=1 Tax=Sulfurovum sp. TaxID=1969726 RepID=UPI002867B842|nr:HAD family hydrolase [Sulfurovum sp.]